ncbi:MAG: family 20 glycosylhydrolase [Muribaculaceae bacterium]|nr:family 20 glycosylhydrolase [Muribaculaceae bacterium]
MKTPRLLLAAITGLALAAPGIATAANPKPFTVPEVSVWKGADGTFTLTPGKSRICYTKPELAPLAEMLAKDYSALTGSTLPTVQGKGGAGDICLRIKPDKKLGAEGYTIDITDRVNIAAPATEGLRWGAATLLQLCSADAALPKGSITDTPAYGFRAFMIDAGRKYIPIDYLHKLVDVMAFRKMNKLHIHLNDNGFKEFFDNDWDKTQAAFRLECESFPGLTARDGAYTKAEFRDLQRHAAERGVEIIPEIDIPAHSLAFTRLKPEIGCDGTHNDCDHLDLSQPGSYTFVDSLLKEYIGGPDPVFTGPRFHIGTDEYQGDSLAMEQFRAFTARYIDYTKSFGKKPLIWGSLTHAKGSTPVPVEGTEMYLWSNGYANPLDMMAEGYDVVSIPDSYVYIVPAAGYYADYLNTAMLYDKWTPAVIGKFTVEEKHPQLLGGAFAVWNDHPNNGITVRDIHHRVMHAIPTLAAKTWSGAEVSVPFAEFDSLSTLMPEAPGVNYLATYGNEPATVFEAASLAPATSTGLDAIGYDYTIEFDIDCRDEKPGTALISNDEATVWLSDPISGTMGYSREGKLMHFRHDIRSGEKHHMRICGDSKGVKFYVDGKLIDDMNISWATYGVKEKARHRDMADVKTLVFPLAKTGDYRSKITNFSVKNR